MYSLNTIRALNADAAERARGRGLWAVPVPDDLATLRVPHLGDLAAEVDLDHDRIDTLFVDHSGFGMPGEAALTQDQFLAKLGEMVSEHGPLLVGGEECGQFQIHVAVWRA